MIVSKIGDGKKFSPLSGISNSILISGEKIMFLLVEMEPESQIPLHSHHHEQMGICLKGKVEFHLEDKKEVIKPNTVYYFRSNEKHGAKVVDNEKAILLEVFSPPREDYLAMAQ